MWKVYKYWKTGMRNEDHGLTCQDCVACWENGDYQAITLADGTGIDDFARMGAEKACSTLAQLLAENFTKLYEMEESLVQFNVITNVQSELYDLCDQYGIELNRLHSTLLGIVIDHEKNRFLAIHLGDGSIGYQRKKKMLTMSYPENGVNKRRTHLTSEHNISKHIRIYKGELGDIEQFVLVSDGWEEKVKGRDKFQYKELFEHAEKYTYLDDISFIALNKSIEYNKNTYNSQEKSTGGA